MEEDKNYIGMIHGDLARASQARSGMPESIGVMSIKTANRTILEASLAAHAPCAVGQFLVRGGAVLPLCRLQRGQVHPCRADSRPHCPNR